MTTRPRLLDLFCGAGGAAMGYHRAGFDVVGVDLNPQPHYPFAFHQADALTFPLNGFDVIHASPPCQGYSVARHSQPGKAYPMLIETVRSRLQASDGVYVIENVVGAPLRDAVTLCGAAFNLTATDYDGARLFLRRHRKFESNVMLLDGAGCACAVPRGRGLMCGGVYGGGPQNRRKAAWRGGATRRGGYTPATPIRRILMGIDWMTQKECAEAIPPVYTEYIGAQLLNAMQNGVRALQLVAS